MIRIVAGPVMVAVLGILMLVVSASTTTASACSEEVESLADGDFVREWNGNGDVWRIQIVNGKRFRFLVLNWNSLAAYGRDDSDINEISRCTFAYLSRSWLGLLHSNYYYFYGVEDSDDGWVWRMKVTSGELSGAGLDLDSIFIIEKADYDQYEYIGIYTIDNLSNIQMASTMNSLDAAIDTPLQNTEIVISNTPVRYNRPLELHWGGGSLVHLKGRLATIGCIVNYIWIWDSGTWYPYSQYGVPHDQIGNLQFKKRYTEFIPARTLYAACIDVCETSSKDCISFDRMLDIGQDSYYNSFGELVYIGESECTQEFSTLTHDKIFPILPLRPDVCIVEIKGIDAERRPNLGLAPATPVNTQPFIVVFDSNSTTKKNSDLRQYTETHELCHQNQYWHWIQQRDRSDADLPEIHSYFKRSQGGRELLSLTGIYFADDRWNLPHDSVYRDIYSKNPLELAAELCALYLLDAAGEKSPYSYMIWNYDAQKFERIHPRKVDSMKYLTPEIRQWLTTYMILPSID